MNVVEGVARRMDAFQRRHAVLAFPIAVVKKFGDDQAGTLAALIAYYGFFSMFPLLLVLVSVLGLVLAGNPALRDEIVNSALGHFPVIGDRIAARATIDELTGNWLSVGLGVAGAAWAGLGVAQAAQRALNTVWDIPRSQWPSFVSRRLRAALMLVILGTIFAASTFTTGFGSSGALPSFFLTAVGWTVSLMLNVVLFTLAYQVLTARDLKWRNVLPGAAVASLAWTVLQIVGGYYLTHQVRSASDIYGTFALVIGLLIWIALGAQVTLLGAEINVVWNRRLWPRSLIQPPIINGDRDVYQRIVERSRMRPEVAIHVSFTAQHDGSREQRDGRTTE